MPNGAVVLDVDGTLLDDDEKACFARFAEHGVGERWQASMEGLVVGLTDESGSLVRYEEDWHLD